MYNKKRMWGHHAVASCLTVNTTIVSWIPAWRRWIPSFNSQCMETWVIREEKSVLTLGPICPLCGQHREAINKLFK